MSSKNNIYYYNYKKQTINVFTLQKLIICLAVSFAVLNNISPVQSRPYRYYANSDNDDDDITEESVDSPQSQSNDGYEDNEPDGPYEESPADVENQAELEKFFDDHLGASDREGMDKENLPTNRVSHFTDEQDTNTATAADESHPKGYKLIKNGIDRHDNYAPINNNLYKNSIYPTETMYAAASELNDDNVLTPAATEDDETALVNSPDKDDNDYEDDNDVGSSDTTNNGGELSKPDGSPSYQNGLSNNDESSNNGVEPKVESRQGDDSNVFVTDISKKPFKIDQLGGYDPEADFDGLSEDLDRNQPDDKGDKLEKKNLNQGSKQKSSSNQQYPDSASKELEFVDTDKSPYSNKATGSDEVSFRQDDPYANDVVETGSENHNTDPQGQVTQSLSRSPAAKPTSEAD